MKQHKATTGAATITIATAIITTMTLAKQRISFVALATYVGSQQQTQRHLTVDEALTLFTATRKHE